MLNQKVQVKQERMLPQIVAAVLKIRDEKDNKCPEEILKRIESLNVSKVVYHFKGSAPVHTSSSSGSLNTVHAWRGGNNMRNHRDSPSTPTGGGFRQSNWDRPGIRRIPSENSNTLSPRGLPSDDSDNHFRRSPKSAPATPIDTSTPQSSFPPGGRYVSSIVSDKNVEDRIIGHIRSKLNKFGHNNYDAVKSFLAQIMSSGETEFLNEFMELLFTKAASEQIYCELYSRLLMELATTFPHLKQEISNIYTNFLAIFQEAKDIPDQSTDDYKKFLEAQQRKKFRQGYSHFLGEIYNKGLLPANAIEETVISIMKSLALLEKDSTNTLLVEEYLVSLAKIVETVTIAKSAPLPPYLVNMLDALKKLLLKPKETTPGYTTKSRFKIMDIVEAMPKI